jgi:hypothetical protein
MTREARGGTCREEEEKKRVTEEKEDADIAWKKIPRTTRSSCYA